MYGRSRDPSLLPRYITDFIVHKKAIRKIFLNGVGNFLREMKKLTFPLLPFCIGGYKFSKVKGDDDFVKDLKAFHFGEIFFQRNNSREKVTEYCVTMKIHYEYLVFFKRDEELYRRSNNLIELSKRFSKKSSANEIKGGSTIAKVRLQKQK